MHTYTALYETREAAEAVQTRLQGLGILDADGVNVFGRDTAGFDTERYSSREHKGIWEKIKDAILPDEDRHVYEEGVRRGQYLLTVSVDEARSDDVHAVLDASNAVDVDEKETDYRNSGYASPVASNSQAIRDEVADLFSPRTDRSGPRVRSYGEPTDRSW